MNHADRIAEALRPLAPKGKLFAAEIPLIDKIAQMWADRDGARKVSTSGLELIKRSEGLRLQAYKCPADVPTIGYGSTGPHVRMGMTITVQEAEDLLTQDLARFEEGVAAIGGKMTQGQFDALVSFAFNLGLGALKGSTLLRKHLAGDYAGAAAAFGLWVNAGGKRLNGLVTRRAAEAALYRGEVS